MYFIKIFILACVQGLAELLPISSSAHVILAEKAMGLDPTAPEMTLLLVMLHTGTMFAVLVYFWKDWREHYFLDPGRSSAFLKQIFLATLATGFLGEILKVLIEKVYLRGSDHAEVETLFGSSQLITFSLAQPGPSSSTLPSTSPRRRIENWVRPNPSGSVWSRACAFPSGAFPVPAPQSRPV